MSRTKQQETVLLKRWLLTCCWTNTSLSGACGRLAANVGDTGCDRLAEDAEPWDGERELITEGVREPAREGALLTQPLSSMAARSSCSARSFWDADLLIRGSEVLLSRRELELGLVKAAKSSSSADAAGVASAPFTYVTPVLEKMLTPGRPPLRRLSARPTMSSPRVAIATPSAPPYPTAPARTAPARAKIPATRAAIEGSTILAADVQKLPPRNA